MGNQIIRQPDGLFTVFSSNTETIVVYDATEDEVVEWFAERAAAEARRSAREKVTLVAAGDPRQVYFQFAMTWDEALAADRDHDGDAWREFGPDGQRLPSPAEERVRALLTYDPALRCRCETTVFDRCIRRATQADGYCDGCRDVRANGGSRDHVIELIPEADLREMTADPEVSWASAPAHYAVVTDEQVAT